MIYTHIKTGGLYRTIGEAFSVELQKAVIIYISLVTGEIFSRGLVDFQSKFALFKDPQPNIKPKKRVNSGM